MAVDPDDPLAPQGARRAGGGAGPAPPGRPAHHRDRATASCAPTPASTCPTSSGARPRCCPSTPTARPARIRDGLRARAGVEVGRDRLRHVRPDVAPGLTDVAIGCAGVAAVVDLRGTEDALGRELQVTEVAWPTSWPRPPSWSWARPPASPSPSSGASTRRGSGRARSRAEIVRAPGRGPLPLRPGRARSGRARRRVPAGRGRSDGGGVPSSSGGPRLSSRGGCAARPGSRAERASSPGGAGA